MKIIVISLVSSLERRASAKRQLDALGLAFEFLDGVDGRISDHPLLDRYDEKKFLIHYGRPANRGELGCYASHYLAWQRCVESKQPVLVLEDDFTLTDRFTAALQTCRQLIEQQGYIRLQETRKSKARFERRVGEFTLVKYTKAPQGGLCYAVTPEVARRFINHSREFSYPLDVFVRHFWIHGAPLYGLTPYVADGGELSTDSIIGQRSKVKKRPLIMVHRFLHKSYVLLMTAVENLKYRLKVGG